MQNYLDFITNFITNYPYFSYLILFFGSFLNVLFPIGLLVIGEIFYISGAILAGLGYLDIKIVFIFLFLGGIIGDISSYYIGKYSSSKIKLEKDIDKELGRIKKTFNKHKFAKLIDDTGGLSIFLARLNGPLSWGSSYIAGYKKYNYLKFLFFTITSSYLSITFFLLIGYYFGSIYHNIIEIFYNYLYFILFLIIYTYLVYFYLFKYLRIYKYLHIKRIKRNIIKNAKKIYGENLKKINLYKTFFRNMFQRKVLKGILKHSILFFVLTLIIYTFFLYLVFHPNKPYINYFYGFSQKITNLRDLAEEKLDTYFLYDDKIIQPINIIIITNEDIDELFSSIGWQKNKIAQKDNISFIEYLSLFKQKTLPVTNMTYLGKSQDFAYQMPGEDNKKRVHIRGWNYGVFNGKKLYVLSISQDIEYDFEWYNNFITPIHEIDKNIDISRNIFLDKINDLDFINKIYPLKSETLLNDTYYETDGNIYIIEY